MTKLDIKLLTRELFANQTSYAAALDAVKKCIAITDRVKEGCILLHNGAFANPQFVLRIKDGKPELYQQVNRVTTINIFGQNVNASGLVVTTKRELVSFFKPFRYINKRFLKSF